jgi:hypothetical protein
MKEFQWLILYRFMVSHRHGSKPKANKTLKEGNLFAEETLLGSHFSLHSGFQLLFRRRRRGKRVGLCRPLGPTKH